MNCPDHRAPTPLLLEPCFWQERIDGAAKAPKRLMLLPRPDLSGPAADVIEWRMRAHDHQRLWGLRALSPFHPVPTGAVLRAVCAAELPEFDPSLLSDGRADFVFQVPAGRKLEDRVLDALRVMQIALDTTELDFGQIELGGLGTPEDPDEFMIIRRLRDVGLKLTR